ncbi:protein-disulfide reductase DsbD [uncultured Thiothrix sp.]|uniref:protein-disulfide reductase DsbD n=1 Tax=uncultured Thiothrix sp. TaxID=223185 RepID=UPI002603E02D|nr:protein-disulfide reductase DsbD [uncultured Thiothrix sp.]
MKNLILICWLFIISLNAAAFPEPLPVDQAFQVSVEPLDKEQVRVNWKIADGYYLYRKKIDLSSKHPEIQLPSLDKLSFPTGDFKTDANFGQMEVYHQSFTLDIPVTRSPSTQQALELEIEAKYQGCADAGLCYPPQKKTFKLQLASLGNTPATPSPNKNPVETTSVDTTTNKLDDAKPKLIKPLAANADPAVEPLPLDQAFKYNLVAVDQKTLVAHWDIQPDHQLYRSRISFSIQANEDFHLDPPLFPAGELVKDDYYGSLEVYTKSLDVSIPIRQTGTTITLPKKLTVITEYQGCSDSTGICYPPVKTLVDIDLSAAPPKLESLPDTKNTSAIQDDAYTSALAGASLLGTILIFFGGGLLLAFTPCVFPMFPILSGVIAGQSDLSARKAFFLSLAYVTASSIAYALIGIFFGLFGANLQTTLQHPVAIGTFATLFVILAFSMFGFFDLQMPTSLQSRLNEFSNKQQGGSLLGAAIMGFISTLIVGPCVAPPLAGALTYIAQTKDAFLGGIALFTMGFAMGIPLLIVGTSAGHLLPRAGTWMDTTKAIFGMLMLGLAISMLKRIVPIEVTMALTGTLLVSSGIYMGALDKISEESTGWKRFWKSIGLIMVFYGAIQLLGVAVGSTNLFQPLKGVLTVSANTVQANHLNFQTIKSVADLEAKLALAKQNQQATMLDFTATWCPDCETLEKVTFVDSNVMKSLQGVQILRADVSAQDELDRALAAKFTVPGPPAILFFDLNGNEIRKIRVQGYKNPEQFVKITDQLPRR